jgi:hypothetical protein
MPVELSLSDTTVYSITLESSIMILDASFDDCNMFIVQGPYSQHSVFFVTYKWEQKASVLHYIRLERSSRNKYASLLGLFVSYQENEVL